MRLLQISRESDGQSIALNVGEGFEIHLVERRMAGRRWHLASNGEPVCKLLEDVVEAAATGAPEGGCKHVIAMIWKVRNPSVSSHLTCRHDGSPVIERLYEHAHIASAYAICKRGPAALAPSRPQAIASGLFVEQKPCQFE
jgi:hypothetical protein